MAETAANWTAFPITYKYIDVSTAHITKEDDEILRTCMSDTYSIHEEFGNEVRSAYSGVCSPRDPQEDIAPAGYAFDQGYWIFVGLGSDWGTVAQRDGSRFSPSFINLYQRGYHSDADWMKIDCDGMIYDDLPKYDW